MQILTTPVFNERKKRTEWLYSHFKHLFNKSSVLDVGCYEAPMRYFIGRKNYIGIDFVGNPDIKINLESIKKLPFPAKKFDTVICIEVLEHLNNLYEISQDLFRVSKSSVLISLPNCWRDARVKLQKGRGSFAHYGLPIKKPMDRHKWFFSTYEAIQFLESIKPSDYELKIILTEPKRNFLVKTFRKLWYSKTAYQNKFCQTIWAEFQKIK